MSLKRKLGFVFCLFMVSVIFVKTAFATTHSTLTWTGYTMCQSCHMDKVQELFGSAHYQLQGPATHMVNGAPVQGKASTAFNSYCINILGDWPACNGCHVGLGTFPSSTPSQAQYDNIDCLICHQKDYKRKKVNGIFQPDTANMTITMDQAVRTIHKPVRANCIQCHAKGGGGDNNKRGDMALAHATTGDRNYDVHMATSGANLACQACHVPQNHRIPGRGTDLRETDLDQPINCSTSSCHVNYASGSHTSWETIGIKHFGRVACQVCHIKTYARNASDTAANEATELARDWRAPEWSTSLNRWEPTIVKYNNLKPEYRFWTGNSWGYSLNDPATLDPATGRYQTSRPVGDIQTGKLYPFKYKTSVQPYATGLNKLIALDTAVYFSTANPDLAATSGLTNMGYSSSESYAWVEDDTFQLITHEVMPTEQALTCTQCHTSSATQMNLPNLGYVLKAAPTTVCIQCHSYKDPNTMSYTDLHNKHVTSKRYDCSWCHSFSRPERGLTMPH